MTTPAFEVVADGQRDVTEAIRSRLLSLSVSDGAGWESDTCRIRIDDAGTFELPRRGAALSVSMGFEGSLVRMGSYLVDEVSATGPPAALTILARAADFRETLKERRTHAWDETDLGGVAGEIAGRHGLRAAVASALRAEPVPHADQTDESDLNFLGRLAAERGGRLKLADGRLVIALAGSGRSVSGESLPTIKVRLADVGDYRAVLADRPRYKSVTAAWQSIPEARRRVERAGKGSPAYALRGTYATPAEAAAAARAKLADLQRSTATLRLSITPGNPAILAGTPVELEGFRLGIPSGWVVATAVHELNRRGSRSRVDLEEASP